jgi:hypothetical protein
VRGGWPLGQAGLLDSAIHVQLGALRSDLILENVGIVSDWDSESDFLLLASEERSEYVTDSTAC